MNNVKRILIVLLFLLPVSVFACAVPMMGSEFDKLIAVEKIGKNTFRAVISKEAEGLNYGASVTIEYYPADAEHRFGKYSKRFFLKEKGQSYVFDFELNKIEGHIPFLQVFWFPEMGGMCGAYGKSKDLVLE